MANRTNHPSHTRNLASAEEGRRRREALREFLVEFSQREMVAPTRREIAEHLGISENATVKHVNILVSEGQVEDLGGTRGLRVADMR